METLLIVEDEKNVRLLLQEELEEAGYDVKLAENAEQAEEQVLKGGIDLVLSDIMMPTVTGLDLLKKLRKNFSMAELPIIMVTAKRGSNDLVLALENGANDYVTKPFEWHVLLSRINTHLRLKRLAKQKDEFIRIASHDLRNCLTAIKGISEIFSSLLTPGSIVNKQVNEMAGSIIQSTLTMDKIISDFLDFQALEDGRLLLNKKPFQLETLVNKVWEHQKSYAQSKNFILKFEFSKSLPPVSADANRIEQVLLNFIGNAIKFCPPESQGTLSISSESSSITLEMSDKGPGLKKGDFKKVFQKYMRLGNEPTGGEKSSGLGLAIAKELIDLHDGEIGVKNNPEGGATFWFKLPLDSKP